MDLASRMSSRNDVHVARAPDGRWVISCANCWGFAGAATWADAMAIANSHAKECQ